MTLLRVVIRRPVAYEGIDASSSAVNICTRLKQLVNLQRDREEEDQQRDAKILPELGRLPGEHLQALKLQISCHNSLLQKCRVYLRENSMEEPKIKKGYDKGKSQLGLFGSAIYFAYRNGIIDEEEKNKYLIVNKRGNKVKHQLCHDGNGKLSTNPKYSHLSYASWDPSQRNLVVKQVLSHRKLIVLLLEHTNREWHQLSNRKKSDFQCFRTVINEALNEEVITEQRGLELRKLNKDANEAKHEQDILETKMNVKIYGDPQYKANLLSSQD